MDDREIELHFLEIKQDIKQILELISEEVKAVEKEDKEQQSTTSRLKEKNLI